MINFILSWFNAMVHFLLGLINEVLLWHWPISSAMESFLIVHVIGWLGWQLIRDSLIRPLQREQLIPVRESPYMQSYELLNVNRQPGPGGKSGLMHLRWHQRPTRPACLFARFKGIIMLKISHTSICKPTSHLLVRRPKTRNGPAQRVNAVRDMFETKAEWHLLQ